MIESYDINDYLKDDKELQKAVIRELFKEITTQQGKIDAYKISENEANKIIAELKAYKDVNEDFKTAWVELKAENERLKEEVETRDNLVGHFRKESINWAKISNDCIKDIENYKQTLQEIKAIAERAFAVCDDDCGNANKFKEIIELTKAEEE